MAEIALDVADGHLRYLTPKMIRKMGRSFWHTSRRFHIQGGKGAVGGWVEFSESFDVDDIESARYVAWYYMLLCKLYIQGRTVEDMYVLQTSTTRNISRPVSLMRHVILAIPLWSWPITA